MKKLISVFAIALFLSIPLAANADPVGTATLALSAGGVAVGNDLTLYYGTVKWSDFGYNIGTNAGIFCISSGNMLDPETLAFNKLTDYAHTTFYSNTPTPLHTISLSATDITELSEAAWIADNYKTILASLNLSSDAQKEAAQLAIWAVLNMGLADGHTAIYHLGDLAGAQTLYNDAGGHDGYTTGNWYAAYNSQAYLTPVPEPGILILLGIAMSAIGMASWKIRKI